MNCAHCDAEISADARFCPACGQPTADDVTRPVETAPAAPPTAALPSDQATGPPPPPRVASAPGALRQDVLAAAQRDLGNATPPVLVRLEESLGDDERVDALAACEPDGSVLAATDRRLVAVYPASASVGGPGYDTLRDVVVLPFERKAVVCALVAGQPFDGWLAPRDQAKNLAAYARERLVSLHAAASGDSWDDDPEFSIGARYEDAATIVAPEGSPIPGRTTVVASIVTTGVQLTSAGQVEGADPVRMFLPWSAVESATLEPPEQSMSRPGVATAIELGVPGASKRASSKRACLVLTTGAGEHVLVLRGQTLEDTAQVLAPVFSRLPGATVTAPVAPAPAAGSAAAQAAALDPIAQIRQLGQLRDDGLLSDEEFEAKKADLLGRI